jgi:hypothetical protein
MTLDVCIDGTHVIRRWWKRDVISETVSETTVVTYDPELNPQVAEDDLRFTPPASPPAH